MIAKSWEGESHVKNLKKLFERLRKYQLKLNPSKCTFGVTSRKIKAIKDMFVPRTQKEVKGFMGWLNYISRFISHLTNKCDPIFKILKKHDSSECDDDY